MVKLNVKLRKGFKYILVGQKEIGNIKYKIPTNSFSIDDLSFKIYSGINKEENIVAFSYKKKFLHPVSSDTIVQPFFLQTTWEL